MAVKKEGNTDAYTVLRECAVGQAGDTVQLTEEEAALLVRDGMLQRKEA